MATITKRTTKNGTKYTAQIRLKEKGILIASETKSFDRKAQAQTWAVKREEELRDPTLRAKSEARSTKLRDIIEHYLEVQEHAMGRTKKADVKKFLQFPIADLPVGEITKDKIIAFVREHRALGAGPATAKNDVIWLRSILRHGIDAMNLRVDTEQVDSAARYLHSENVIGPSKARTRRTSDEEINAICHVLDEREGSDVPMSDIVWFAVHSTRRQAEITRVRWGDYDPDRGLLMVRDVKHPRKKIGNHKWSKLLPEAMEIIDRQPRTGELIFPYNPKTVGTYFRDAAKIAGVTGIKFHDLRHEGTSRLFEKGYPIPEVQLFTLHAAWTMLQRYTHLLP